MLEIDPGGRIPIYEQIINGMTRHIMYGIIGPGEQIPSVRALASVLAINPNTVQKAYQYLEENRMIYSVPGKGSFAAEKPELSGELLNQLKKKLEQSVYEAVRMGYPRRDFEALVTEIYEKNSVKEGEGEA